MTITELSPGLTLILGSVLIPLLRGRLRSAYMVLLPLLGLVHLSLLSTGEFGVLHFVGQELVTLRVDRWSMVFGWIFMIATLISAIYALHLRSPLQATAGFAYAGSAIGAVFAGDLMTLFVFWELTAVTSVLLVWAGGGLSAYRAGMRYLIVQIASGMLLFFGALVQLNATGSISFEHIGLDAPGGWLIFAAFGIKCAFPFLHNWLQDAYPEASEVGTVFLSAFTTKLAVYALARGFAGEDLLIPIGAAMAAFPIFYAVIENDLRRVLAYSLNNQLGFMVVGIGIGTELSLNGTAAHAFSHILYKALLFMSMGAVLYRVGTVKGSELGGLYKSMPLTAIFCIIGAASISGFPLFSGFVSKSMILSATGMEAYMVTWAILLFASAGVFHHSGIKIPYFAFFAHDSGKRCQEAPANMLIAMGIAAFLCIAIGVMPGPLYALLPYPVEYVPYTSSHVLAQLQLLMFSALAFSVLMWTRIYPPELRSVNLDFDWFYRVPLVRVTQRTGAALRATLGAGGRGVSAALGGLVLRLEAQRGPSGLLAKSWPTGSMALWVMVMLLAYLLFYYVG
ncbi:MAG: Na(+)/H(+) antiporter subunit D [Rhodocyclaceae bacterium]|nr:Na(+)/H(+) antiporter subunit D [Rhodocyclaceae bacterium]MDP1957526.1 Na(+)/H(+) antiporter subunit D [Rhodocyclaceae bacterium]